LVLALAMIWTVGSWLIWPVMFAIGTSAFAIYTTGLTILGDNFKGSDLVAGSAAFAAMWGIGGLLGPPIAGVATDAFGVDAIPLTICVIYVLLLLCLAFTRGRFVQDVAHG
jgi:fucose permease